MTEKELEGAKKLIENKDVKKGSYSFIGDSNGFRFQDEDGEVWNIDDTEMEVIGNIYEV